MRRSRWLSVLAAGFIGYLIGDWHAATVRSVDFSPSPSQSVALRFPEAKADTPVTIAVAAPGARADAGALTDAQRALFSPQPMVPGPRRQSAAAPPAESAPPPSPERVSAESVTAPGRPAPAPLAETHPENAAAAATIRPAAPAPSRPAARQPALDNARHASRPGFLLNDAQIASIKERLHLTPDQERMWPAVEAALRNIAYAKARGRRPGIPSAMETASLDADSAEVQGLKSAAIPLIMSFSDEQKNEVRSLAHVMGLDRLASEF